MKRRTWTIEPAVDVKSIVAKEIVKRVGRGGKKRGVRTKIINDSLRSYLKHHLGKREAAAINGKTR